MNASSFFLLLATFSLLLLFFQRTEAKKRALVGGLLLIPGFFIVRYINYRDIHTEAQIAFAVAFVLNGLFWLLIGRYNPPGRSDDIQVIGMDD